MKPRSAPLFLSLLFALSAGATAQLTPPATGGVVELDRLLQRLAEPRRVLMIAAHPDDEDTSLLARVARGYGAEAAYFSLSRGEGGQNLIGPELGHDLGLLRSRELEAARQIDGARQFFSRAFDFGYTRSLDETATKWPLDSLLKDAVRIVRRFRPHVIVSVFSGTPRDGHGQHQAAGVTARRAFDVAGDVSRFPELATEEGLAPWTPSKLFRSTRFDTTASNASLSTGDLDPRTGRSYHQIAMESRSQHRSQDMGTLQQIGPRRSTMRLLEDRTNTDNGSDPFSGIVVQRGRLGEFADSLRAHVSPSRLADVADAIAAELPRHENDPRLSLLEQALAVAAGIVVDGVASTAEVVPGDTFGITLSVYNGGDRPVTTRELRPVFPGPDGVGWVGTTQTTSSSVIEAGHATTAEWTMDVPPGASLTTPYFLVNDPWRSMYDWSRTPPEIRGLPFEPPLLVVEASLTVRGVPITVRREIAYRYRDQAIGEIRRALRVVPAIDVKITPGQLVWPVDRFPDREFAVTLTNNRDSGHGGEVWLEIDGWSGAPPPPRRYRFARAGESRTVRFTLTPPPGVRDAELTVRAVVEDDAGARFSDGVEVIDYPHIRPVARARPAVARVVVSPIVLPAVARVGYIRGAADRVPEALTQLGLSVELLTETDLASGDLGAYDVIVVGSRAYETDDALTRHNRRLLEYARRGGHLVVQYQQYAFERGNFAPYPVTIGRPHDRVTDENAPVTVLRPDHPMLNGPNRIVTADWEGWPQERGLYFANTWDEAYQPLLEMNDPGGPRLRGSLLVADYGAGTYVYTGLSFFRSLPGGNAGAFKLFLNVIGYTGAGVP